MVARPASTPMLCSKTEIADSVARHFAQLNARRAAGERELGTRYYQIEAWEAIFSAYDRGVRRQMLVMPTGSGKTVTFATLAWLMGQRLGRTPRVLVLAHRKELIKQAIAAFRSVYPTATRGRIAGSDCVYSCDITAAMVPTLGREDKSHPNGWGWKLRRYAQQSPDLVIVDESHHSPASTYLRVLEATFGPHTLRLGVTATPNRSDGLALAEVYDEIVYQYSLQQAIEDGFLVPPRGVRHTLQRANLDQVQISKTTGDFSEGSLGKIFDTPEVRAEAIAAWEKNAKRPRGEMAKTILFACTVAHAEHLAEDLVARGYRAAAISQQTSEEERDRLYQRLAAGELDVLASVMVLTEGFDEPSIECVFLVRPTQSWSLFVQMVGRGLRLYEDKTSCLVLDISGNTSRFSLIGLNMLGGFQVEETSSSESSGGGPDSPQDVPTEGPQQGILSVTVGDGHAVNLVQLRFRGRYQWQETPYGMALLLGSADTGGIFLIRKHDPERDKLPLKCEYLFKVVHMQCVGESWRAEVAAQKLSADEAMALCEQEAPRLGGKRSRNGMDTSTIVAAPVEVVEQAVSELAAKNREVNARLSRPMRDAAISATPDQRRRLKTELELHDAADDPRIVKGEAMRIIGWAAQVKEIKARLGIAALRSAWNLTHAQVAELIVRGDLVRMVTHGWRTGFTQIQRPAYLAEVSP